MKKFLLFFGILISLNSYALRIKEVASIQGVRSNQLTGYGLVVGLDGTGDQTSQMPYTSQALQNYLKQMNITLPANLAGQNLQLKNVAAVIVTAELPSFAQIGQTLDVTVSSMGNAKSLKGGTLITTTLRGVDGEIYALAQGNLVIGGAGASQAGSKVQINHLSAGRIPAGANVERTVENNLIDNENIRLNLHKNDFQVADQIIKAINKSKGGNIAQALDGRTILINVPESNNEKIAFLASIENLNLPETIPTAKVIINARTGSIVMNQSVTLGNCAIAHGNLSITIDSTKNVSQPNSFSEGETVVTEKANIKLAQEKGTIVNIPSSPKLTDVISGLNLLGASPADLLAILQAMKVAGALNAELEII